MEKPISPNYDVVICGAGPAGLVAGLKLRELFPANFTIALLDKRSPWREPAQCAEAVHNKGLHRLVQVNPDWIRSPIDGVIFVSPEGTRIKYSQPQSGLLINRTLMHKDLAQRCSNSNIDCCFSANVKSISILADGVRTLSCLFKEEGERQIKARYIIDASGAGASLTCESNLAKGDFDVEPAIFALVKGLKFETNFIQMFFGQKIAPGGYAWLFPRDSEIANLGIVCGREYLKTKSPRKYFNEWLKKEFPEAEVISVHGGPIACGQSFEPIAKDHLFKAGDSADMVNPISRGGILEAMKAGKLAAECIYKIEDSDSKTDQQKIYDYYFKHWMKIQGGVHDRLARAKPAFGKIPDVVLNKAARKIAAIPTEKRTLFRIFWETLVSSPGLLFKMRSLMH
jgi:geranylgeranyl reductase family protein